MFVKRFGKFKLEFGLAVAILLVGFAVRVLSLTSAPLGLGGDEIFYYNDAVRILTLGDFQIYYPTNYGHEPLFIYAEALTVVLFGHHAFTLRYTAVIGGLLMMAGSYALARRMFNGPVALWALAMFASIFWPVFLTRVGLRAFTFPLLTVFSIYALWRALEESSWKWSWWAGIFNGLALYTYIASRVFPAVAIGWCLVLMILKRDWVTRNLKRLVLIFGLASLIVLPYLLFALANPGVVNQRPDTMGGPFFEIQRGDFSGLWRNLVALAGMFTFRGDPDERYNAFQLPVFDAFTGLLCYLGIVVSIWRIRQPAYALLWVWLGIGLIPTALSNPTPAWLRAGGALFPVLVLPGLGVGALMQFLSQWRTPTKLRQVAGVLALIVAVVVGMRTLSLFLGPWHTSTEMTKIYESDIYLAAQYLKRNPPPPETQVYIMARSASDADPMLFDLQSSLDERVHWASEMVWPAASQETWYLFTREVLPNSLTQQWLGATPAHIETDNAGDRMLEVYRLAKPSVPPQPEQPFSAQFEGLVDLLGISYPEPLQRGTAPKVLLFWRVRPGFAFDPTDWPRLVVRLRDGQKIWSQADESRLAFPPLEWQADAVWVQTVTLPLPADAPPIPLQPEVGIYSSTYTWPVRTGADEPARLAVTLPPVQVVGQPTSAAPLPSTAIPFDDRLVLQSTKLNPPPIGPQPGLPLFVETTWRALASLPTDGAVQLRLLNAANVPLAETEAELIYAAQYPTSRWLPNEVVTSQHRLTIPADAPAGEYQVQLRWLPAIGATGSEWKTFAPLTVAGRPHTFTQPLVDGVSEAQVGDVAELVGYRLEPQTVRIGEAMRLTVVWRALRPTERQLKVFVHLYGLEDAVTIFGQHDSEPGNGTLPTLGWVAGEYLEDEHLVPVEASTPPGTYRIGVGMYNPDTVERLPVQLSDGTTADHIILTNLEVQP